MMARRLLGLIALVVSPAYAQQSSGIPSVPTPSPQSATNAIPPARGFELRNPDLPNTPAEGISSATGISRNGIGAVMDMDEHLQSLDKAGRNFVENVDRVRFGVQHGAGLTAAYREGGAEGMAVYIGQGFLDKGGEMAGEMASGAYTGWRAGSALAGGPAAAVAGSFWLGTTIGDVIKNTVHWNGQSLETHVTNFYFNNLHGRIADQQFNEITSDAAIEEHRQKLRQQRAAQFSRMQSNNQQAAANRAAMAAQQSTNDNAAAMNDLMLQLLPAAIAASQRPPVRAPYAAPGASPLPQLEYRTRCYGDGRKLGSNEVGPSHCWQEPVYPGTSPAGRSAPMQTVPLGSTFGSQPATTTAARDCQPRERQPNVCVGNAECRPC